MYCTWMWLWVVGSGALPNGWEPIAKCGVFFAHNERELRVLIDFSETIMHVA